MPKRRQSDNDNQMYDFLAVKEFLFIVLGRRKTVYIVRKLHVSPCSQVPRKYYCIGYTALSVILCANLFRKPLAEA